MTEYIERDYNECITKHRAKHFVCEFCNEHCSDEPCEPSDCEWMQYIDSEPAADVVEVRHGRWYDVNSYEHGERAIATCSHCRVRGAVRTKRTEYGFWVINSPMCPNCGARMDGAK